MLLLYVHSESLLSVQFSAMGKLVLVTETQCLGRTILGHLPWMGWETRVVPGNAVVGHGFLSQPSSVVTDCKPPLMSLYPLNAPVWWAPSSEDRTLGPRKPLTPAPPSPLPCTPQEFFNYHPFSPLSITSKTPERSQTTLQKKTLSILWAENLHATPGRGTWSPGGPGRENLKENKPSKWNPQFESLPT